MWSGKASDSMEKLQIVGVMPADFQLPISGSDLWVPLAFPANVAKQRGAHYLSVVGRLKAGVSVIQATEELKTIAARLAVAYPNQDAGWTAFATDFRTAMVGDVRPALLILLARSAW